MWAKRGCVVDRLGDSAFREMMQCEAEASGSIREA
jgi:hypothetical protein